MKYLTHNLIECKDQYYDYYVDFKCNICGVLLAKSLHNKFYLIRKNPNDFYDIEYDEFLLNCNEVIIKNIIN